MSSDSLTFRTAAGPMNASASDRAPIEADEICVVVAPADYQRIVESTLFGLIPENLPNPSPIQDGTPVTLTLRWRGADDAMPAPTALDTSFAEADWQLTAVTQPFEGIDLGFRTVGPDDEIAQVVLDFLTVTGWPATRLGPDEPFQAVFTGSNGELEVQIHIDEARRILLVLAILPLQVSADRLQAITELALRRNASMDLASVDVDLYDPDEIVVRLRSSADFDGVTPSTAMVRNVVSAAVIQGDALLPEFLSAAQ